jgi:hypothetical protein
MLGAADATAYLIPLAFSCTLSAADARLQGPIIDTLHHETNLEFVENDPRTTLTELAC